MLTPSPALLLLTLSIAGQEPETSATALEPPPLSLTYLANEGVLLRAGEDAVLVDAFVGEPYSLYPALTPAALEELRSARGIFAGIDLALVSHEHRDHFQPDVARAYLAAAPECLFASSPDVLRMLNEGAGPELDADRLRAVLPEPGERVSVEVGDIRVDVLRLSHGSGRFARIQNLGHVVSVGGFKVLHVGDAAMSEAMFTPYRLAEEELDVALVPYWYFSSEEGLQIVRRHFRARVLVAVHVPEQELDATAEVLARVAPDTILFRECLESRSFEPATSGGR